jgi:hypothetical protein
MWLIPLGNNPHGAWEESRSANRSERSLPKYLWGIVVTLTGVVKNFSGLCAVRVLLGIFE